MKRFFLVVTLIIAGLFGLGYLIKFGAEADDAAKIQRAKEHAAEVVAAIAKKSVIVGMTMEEVVKAWGKPERRNTSGGAGGSREQWVFEDDSYLYFKDGRLVSWQQTK